MIRIALEIGIIMLLTYLPLASGGVTNVSVMLFELVVGLLAAGWLIALAFPSDPGAQPRRSDGWRRRRTTAIAVKPRPQTLSFQITLPPAWGAILVFILLIAAQLAPWPVGLVRFLSPAALALHVEAAAQTLSALPEWLPLSLVTQATETELGKFVAYALLFLVVVNVVRTPAKVRRILAVLFLIGGIEALYGLSQVGQARISGTFVNQNHFAGYLELLIPLTFGMLLAHLESSATTGGRTAVERWVNDKLLKTILIIVLIAVLSLAVFLSGSRGSIISVSVGMACFCVFAYTRRLLRKWVSVILACVGLVFGLAVFASPASILQRVGALARPETETTFQYRWNVWKDSLGMVRDFPLSGSGLGTFSHLFARYQKFPSDLTFTHAENDYVQVLTETGIVGISIVGWAIMAYGLSTIAAWRRQRSRWPIAMGLGGISALISMVVHSTVDFNLHIPSNAVLFTVIAALTYVVVHFERQEGEKGAKDQGIGGIDAFDPAHPSSLNFVCRTRYLRLQCTRPKVAGLLLAGFLISGGGIMWSLRAYAAFLAHQQFLESMAMVAQGYLTGSDVETITVPAWQSLRYDGNNADYHFALGSYLYQAALTHRGNSEHDVARRLLDEAEQRLRRAVRYDPANPWYYYELARVSLSQGACEISGLDFDPQTFQPPPCPTARYFWAALTNAPHQTLIRWQAGGWYARYFPGLAEKMMNTLIARSLPESADEQAHSSELARFLYDCHLDYQSDQELARFMKPAEPVCETVVNDDGNLEIRYDDGKIPDWRAFLTAETIRVKKVLCLPDNLDAYRSAALRIFMNHGGQGNFITSIRINRHLAHEFYYDVPDRAEWQEIPIALDLLQGASEAHIYIRTIGATASQNALQVWGDADTPTRNSVSNFRTTADVSTAPGIQTGEYLIRLVLYSHDRTADDQ